MLQISTILLVMDQKKKHLFMDNDNESDINNSVLSFSLGIDPAIGADSRSESTG